MPLVAAYFRPDSLDEALSLLADPNRIPLAGGTTINADRERSDIEVVDLQALGLDAIESTAAGVRIGATASLAKIADAEAVPNTLRAIARAEEGSTLRTLATIGGTIASASAESVLVAALLVHDSQVELAGADDMALADLLASGVPPQSIITAVTIDAAGTTLHASTGRTPADTPIVAAVARSTNGTTSLALTGVADTPILVDPVDPTSGLAPAGDFRGSSTYRIELARVLSARALEGVR